MDTFQAPQKLAKVIAIFKKNYNTIPGSYRISFRENHYTSFTLIEIVENIRQSIDEGKIYTRNLP